MEEVSMPIAEVVAAVNALRAVKDLVTVGFNAKVDSEVQAFKLELGERLGKAQDTLFNLREKMADLQEENAALKKAAAERDEWNSKEAEYERFQAPGGAWIYRSKTAPSLLACPICIAQKRLTELQPKSQHSGQMHCLVCEKAFQVTPPNYPRLSARGGGPAGWMGE
jgi:hypothetical protein